MILTFSGTAPEEELCHTVSIQDDTFVEHSELFLISLTTSEELVTIPITSAVIIIEENDGMKPPLITYVHTFKNMYINT